MNTPDVIPSAEPSELSKRCKAALLATADLADAMTNSLPVEKKQALLGVLVSGGRVGLELTIDAKSKNKIALIAIEQEGSRHELATIETEHRPAH